MACAAQVRAQYPPVPFRCEDWPGSHDNGNLCGHHLVDQPDGRTHPAVANRRGSGTDSGPLAALPGHLGRQRILRTSHDHADAVAQRRDDPALHTADELCNTLSYDMGISFPGTVELVAPAGDCAGQRPAGHIGLARALLAAHDPTGYRDDPLLHAVRSAPVRTLHFRGQLETTHPGSQFINTIAGTRRQSRVLPDDKTWYNKVATTGAHRRHIPVSVGDHHGAMRDGMW